MSRWAQNGFTRNHTACAYHIEGMRAEVDPEQTVHEAGSPIAFSAAVDVPTGTQVAYAWDMGDETAYSGAAVEHAYQAAGTYQVHVVATTASCAFDLVGTIEVKA